MNARGVIIWLAALALGALSWFAFGPVWTQGLGLCALDGDGQPGLWLAAAKASLVLAGGGFLLRLRAVFAAPKASPVSPAPAALTLGLCATALVLFAAMVGQPLRAWFLVAHGEWGNPMVRTGLGLLAGMLTLCVEPRRKAFRRVVALAGGAAFLPAAVAINLSVVGGPLVIPTMQDWLVLAFALGCGIFAAGIRCCVVTGEGAATAAEN